jgi:hypothetical protein
MEDACHNSQQDLLNKVSHFRFDIDLDIDWRTFSQEMRNILRHAFRFSNEDINQYQNGKYIP